MGWDKDSLISKAKICVQAKQNKELIGCFSSTGRCWATSSKADPHHGRQWLALRVFQQAKQEASWDLEWSRQELRSDKPAINNLLLAEVHEDYSTARNGWSMLADSRVRAGPHKITHSLMFCLRPVASLTQVCSWKSCAVLWPNDKLSSTSPVMEISFLLLKSSQDFAVYDSILQNTEAEKSLLRSKGRKLFQILVKAGQKFFIDLLDFDAFIVPLR